MRHFTPDAYARALEDWSWLIASHEVEPVAASVFGDLFLRVSGGICFLDMLEGALTLEWSDVAELQSELSTPEGQDRYLMGGLAIGASSAGVAPNAAEVLAFKTPPVLGGPITVDNIEAMDYVVASSIAGQLHRQVKDLPPGTPITGFSLDVEGS